jgi:hypothetical protein
MTLVVVNIRFWHNAGLLPVAAATQHPRRAGTRGPVWLQPYYQTPLSNPLQRAFFTHQSFFSRRIL